MISVQFLYILTFTFLIKSKNLVKLLESGTNGFFVDFNSQNTKNEFDFFIFLQYFLLYFFPKLLYLIDDLFQ